MSASPRASRRRPHRVRIAGFVALVVVLVAALAPTSVAARPAAPGDAGRIAGSPATVTTDATITPLEGIDVSHWQGTINWTSVAGAGKKFAIIKATESTSYLDPMYATNHAQAKAAGLWTGAYHFARPSSTANDAILEADWFVAHANLGVGDLIPALDLEDSGGLSVAGLQAWVTSFLGEVTAKIGRRPMIYTSPAFWTKYMGDSHALADAGYTTLWIAHWGVTSPTVPANNWGGHGWTFWQYTSSGTVPGISGRVDLDRFNGTDLGTQAYSIFKLAASLPSGGIKQGASSGASVSILRTNFTTAVTLDVQGLPAGATASFAVNPTTASSSSFTVTLAADPSATPVGTYPLTISGVGGDLTRTITANLIVADGIPPTVTAPTTGLAAGWTLGTTTVPVRIAWSATDPSGIASTALQRRINGGTWTTTPLAAVAAMSAVSSIPFGATATQRVRATDRKANTSAWVAGVPIRAAVYQQTSSAVTWTGTWHTQSWSSASGGSARYATTAGASATFSFTGRSIAFVGAKGPTRGGVRIYVDGVYAGAYNEYASSGNSRVIIFARNWASSAPHTLKVVVLGTAGHPRVDVDAFIRLS